MSDFYKNINLNLNRLINLDDPINPTDGVNLRYIQAFSSTFSNGLTNSTGITKLGGSLIENTTINLSAYKFKLEYGTFEVSGSSIISGTSGNGYLSFLSQTTSVINTTASLKLYSNSTNDLTWISNSYSKTLSATNSTGNRTYLLQDKSGILAHLDDIFPDTITTELTPVISILNTAPVSPLDGDRYLIGTASTGIWATYSNYTVQYDDTLPDWVYVAPLIDNVVYVTNTLTTYRYNGTAWVNYMGTAILQNGNTLGGIVNIGTKDNFNVTLKTNNTNRLLVTTAGSVAIGTTQSVPPANVYLKVGGIDGQNVLASGGDGFVTIGKIGATKQWGLSLNSVGTALTTANATLYASSVGVNTSASWGIGTTLNAVSTTTRGSIILANAGTGNVLFRADSVRFTPIASANTAGTLSILGVNTSFEFVSPAHTNQDAGVETIAFDNNFTNSIQHQTGTMSLQRDWVLRPRTHRFIGASVITNAYSMWIGGEPIAGTNAIITNSWALGVTGKSQLSGNIFSINTYSDLSHSATASFLGIDSTGKLFNTNISSSTSLINGTGTLNYISKFSGTQSLGNSLIYDDGTNIGIGTASPIYKLDIVTSNPASFRTSVIGNYNSMSFSSDYYSTNMTLDAFTSGIIGSGGSGIDFKTSNVLRGSISVNIANQCLGLVSSSGYNVLLDDNKGDQIILGYANDGIYFITNSIDRLRITAAGDLIASGLYTNITNSGTSSFLGIDSTGKLFNTNISSNTQLLNGTGTLNYISKFTGTQSLGNSLIYDNGTNVGINTVSSSATLHLRSISATTSQYALKIDDNSNNPLFYVRNSSRVIINGVSSDSPSGLDTAIFTSNLSGYTFQHAANITWLYDGTVKLFNAIGADYGTVGTLNSHDLILRTNNTDRLFIHRSSGYIGIGTGSPSASLHIVGYGASPSMTMLSLTNPYQTIFNVYDDGNLYSPSTYNITTSSPTASFLGIDNTGKLFNTNVSTSTIVGGSGSINYISKFTGTYSLGNSIIYDDGTNIGIGTQSDGLHRVNINGDVNIQGTLYATSKSFEIKHPLIEGKRLVYGSLEGPEYGIYHRGKLENNNVIELPDYWTKLADENTITVNITPIGKYQKIYVDKILDNKIYLSKNAFFNKKNITCYYIIYAERKDIPKIKLIK